MKLAIASALLCLCSVPALAWTITCDPDPSDTTHAYIHGTSDTPPDRSCDVSATIVQAGGDNTFTDTQSCGGASLPNGAQYAVMCVLNARPGTQITSIAACNASCNPP